MLFRSSDPNMQNVPESIRSIFVADNIFNSLDANQIELRVMAWLSQDKVMGQALARGEDLHEMTNRELNLNNRKLGKTLNFAVSYGGTVETIVETARGYGIYLQPDMAHQLMMNYFKRFKGLADWIGDTRASVIQTGMTKTMFGRIRRADPFLLHDNRTQEKVLKEMVNMPVQGTAAEIVKMMMARTGGYDLRIQVHDDLLFDGDCPPLSLFENVAPFPVPMKLAVGKEWGNLTKV